VQIHPAALPLDLVDVALAVVLAASLEGQQLRVPREHPGGTGYSLLETRFSIGDDFWLRRKR
jgi:hypothetical protein